MWSGRDSGVMYTIRQSGGAKFYVTRAIDRSYFASTRSLALAKVMAQDDAAEHVKKQEFKAMAHKFKIGQMVNYYAAARALRESGGAYSVTGFLPEKGGQPMYRIKHFSEDHHRVAQESELSAVQPGRSLRARGAPLSDRD